MMGGGLGEQMKIAVLLLVHKNKEQLERLLMNMSHANIDIFVHVDQKCDFSPDEIRYGGSVRFTEKRYNIGLFEFSMVDAEMELIRTARKYGEYQYFVLMSCQCYPLCKTEELYCCLKERYPEPFIEIVSPTKENYVKKNFAHVYILKRLKLRTYDVLKKVFPHKVFRLLRYLPGGFVFGVSAIKELFYGSPKKRLQAMGFPLYCGSQWWILPDRVIDNVLAEYDNKKFCKAIYDTFSCDETFFQTAIMKKSIENGIVLDEKGNYMNKRWYFVFSDGHPITLTKNDYPEIANSGMWFARKFDTTVDQDILDIIDREKLTCIANNDPPRKDVFYEL